VVEAAVVGIPDEILGEAIAAFVTVSGDGNAEPEVLLERCRERLPQHMVPGRLEILPRFPRIGAGKIDKRALVPQDRSGQG
jgi:acyl-CoA synthetase (AMP-forming)/AMP-acid ligase II